MKFGCTPLKKKKVISTQRTLRKIFEMNFYIDVLRNIYIYFLRGKKLFRDNKTQISNTKWTQKKAWPTNIYKINQKHGNGKLNNLSPPIMYFKGLDLSKNIPTNKRLSSTPFWRKPTCDYKKLASKEFLKKNN